MFNTYINKRTEHVPYVKEVREIRAPTDESVKLLKEMEEKAREKILDSIVIKEASLEIACIVYQDHSQAAKIADCKLKLNGKDYKFKIIMEDYEMSKLKREAVPYVRDIISKEVTRAIFTTPHD